METTAPQLKMNIRATLILLCFIAFGIGSGWYYLSEIKQKLSADSSSDLVFQSPIKESLVFAWNDLGVMKGRKFGDTRKSLLAELGEVNQLEIVAYYDVREENPGIYSDIGLARAMEIRNLFPELSDDRFIYSSEAIELDPDKDYYEACKLIVVANNAPYSPEPTDTL